MYKISICALGELTLRLTDRCNRDRESPLLRLTSINLVAEARRDVEGCVSRRLTRYYFLIRRITSPFIIMRRTRSRPLFVQ